MDLAINVRRGIANADVKRWKEVSQGCGLHLSYQRLIAYEEEGAQTKHGDKYETPYYIFVKSDGQLLGAAVCFLIRKPKSFLIYTDPSWLFEAEGGSLKGEELASPEIYPFLLCGAASGQYSRLIVAPDLPASMRATVIERLNAGVQLVAANVGARASAWAFLPTTDACELLHIDPTLNCAYFGMHCSLPVTDFETYLGSLSKKRQRKISREIRAFSEASLDTSVLPLAEVADSFEPLIASQHSLWGLPTKGIHTSIGKWLSSFRDSSFVLCAMRNGKMVGGVLLVEHNGLHYHSMIGLDESIRKEAFVLFNLSPYAALKYAHERGASKIVTGLGVGGFLTSKVGRGSAAEPLWHLFHSYGLSSSLNSRLLDRSKARAGDDLSTLRGYQHTSKVEEHFSSPVALNAFSRTSIA